MSTNAFVEAAQEAAAPAAPVTVSNELLVHLFLSGAEAASEEYATADGVLSEDNSPIARMTKDGTVLLPSESHYDTKFNDALISAVAARGVPFRRISSFNRLTRASDRVKELDKGNYDDFRAVAGLFELDYSDEDFAALDRARAFRERVETYFTELEEAEKAKAKAAADIARKERAAKAAITWDDGTGSALNRDVQGEGGGQRLRLRKEATPRRGRSSGRVDTSTGNSLTLNQAKRAFDFASRYWHGGKEIPHDSWHNTRKATLAARSYGGYATEVRPNSLHFGCQQITRAEAERFADVMGWERAGEAEVAEAA